MTFHYLPWGKFLSAWPSKLVRNSAGITVWLGLFLGLHCLAAADAELDFPLNSQLRFRSDKTFKIITFGDVHWDRKSDKDHQTLRAMETIVESEKPDFVLYLGDNSLSGTLRTVREGYRQLTEPVVRRGIPWAVTLGNHDAEDGGLSRKEVFRSTLGQPGNLSRPGPKDIHGDSNFILPIMERTGNTPAALLYVLDSNAYFKQAGLDTYDWIRQNQIQWYRKASEFYRQKNQGQFLPSYAFFHIPLPEFGLFFTNKSTVGVKQEDVCCSAINSGLCATILEHRDIKAVFCGHDHVNDFITGFSGLWLGYARGISHNTYGKEGYPKGARVIVLNEAKASFDTWLRLEDKQVVNVVHCE